MKSFEFVCLICAIISIIAYVLPGFRTIHKLFKLIAFNSSSYFANNIWGLFQRCNSCIGDD